MPKTTDQRSHSASLPIACAAIVLMAVYRAAPHPWNVAPASALFLLGGLYLGKGWCGWAIPFVALIVSDAILYWQWDHTLWRPERLIDYGGFALIGLLGRAAADRPAGVRIGAVAAAPFVFYLVSNFGVWLNSHGLYARTSQGLVDCYVAGLPFLRGTVMGDWLFAGAGILATEAPARFTRVRTGHQRKAPLQRSPSTDLTAR